jgi:hypothetical protein
MEVAMRLVTKVGGILLCAGSFLIVQASDDPKTFQGRWSINNWTPGDSLQLTMKVHSGTTRWEWGSSQPIADLHGLTLDQLHAARTPVRFTLERDAGTFAFEGTVTLGVGSGDFRFAADPTFKAKLGALGYDVVDQDDASIMMMAVRDISIAYAGEVKRSGLRGVTVRDLVRLRDHGVDLEFLRDLTMIGYASLSADDVVSLRDHGVDSAFIRTLKASGYPDLPAADIVALRDHGVDSRYIEGLDDSGYGKQAARDIVRLRDHGIEPVFIKDLLIAKPGPYSIDEIIKLREHGVDPRYVARIQEAGFKELTVDQIVSLREHGVD